MGGDVGEVTEMLENELHLIHLASRPYGVNVQERPLLNKHYYKMIHI